MHFSTEIIKILNEKYPSLKEIEDAKISQLLDILKTNISKVSAKNKAEKSRDKAVDDLKSTDEKTADVDNLKGPKSKIEKRVSFKEVDEHFDISHQEVEHDGEFIETFDDEDFVF